MSVTLFYRKRGPKGHPKTYAYLISYKRGQTQKWELLGILSGDRFQDKETKRLFEETRIEREREQIRESNGVVGTQRRGDNFIRYCRKLAESRPAKNTRLSWAQAIEHLESFGGEKLTFRDLDREIFERFRDYLLKTAKLSPNSAQVYLARIKTAIHRAVEDNILTADPSARVKIPKEDSLPVHFSIEEIQALAETECPNQQVKAAFLFSCFAGLRYSDVEALTWDSVKDGYLEFRQQKTRQAERLPLTEEAVEILKEQRTAKPSENLRRTFPPGTVFFMPSQPVVDKQLKRWGRDAGIKKRISFHTARHTFATLSLSSGVDLYTTSRLLGHKNLATTQIYAKVIDETKRQAVAMFPRLTTRLTAPRSKPINDPKRKKGKK